MRLSTSLALAIGSAGVSAKFSFGRRPPENVPTPTENFTWSDPFALASIRDFDVACSTEATFAADEFQLHDLQSKSPEGLWNYGDALKKVFAGRPYPGGWDGIDRHLHDRELLRMSYDTLPLAVREWIEEQDRSGGGGKGLFAVYDKPTEEAKVEAVAAPPAADRAADVRAEDDKKKVVLFTPGALYSILPLWVAEKSGCKDSLLNLDAYSPKPLDGGVVAWTTGHTEPDRETGARGATFTIKAQVLKAKAVAEAVKEAVKEAAEKAAEETRDEL